MAQRFLHLVRHAQAARPAKADDERGPGLTSLGIQQARLVGRRFSELPISAIHFSSLRRTTETAAIISDQIPSIPLRPSRLLWECIPPVSPSARKQFFADKTNDELRQQRHQAERAFEHFCKPIRGDERHEVLVCHGNLIRYFVCRALQAPPELWLHTDIYNCGISIVIISPEPRLRGDIMLLSHNDIGHLPPNLRSFT